MERKTCPRCERRLSRDYFGWRDAAHTSLQSYCRECMRGAWADWYSEEKNREHHLDLVSKRRRKRIEKHRRMINERKSQPCVDCGCIYPPYVMDFDHLGDDKSDIVSKLAWTRGTDVLIAEMDKCEVVCANCHRERTQRRLRLLYRTVGTNDRLHSEDGA